MDSIRRRLPAAALTPDLGLGPWAQRLAMGMFQPTFLALHAACEVYAAQTALGLCLDLGWEPALKAGATVDELIVGFAPQARIPTAWMLPFLAEEGFLREEDGRFFLDYAPELQLAEIRRFALEQVPGHEANFDLLDAVRLRIRPFFTEGRPGEALLFDLSLLPHWTAYFRNENLIYYPNNLFALVALLEGLPEGARVLEIGAGSGSFARLLAKEGTDAGHLARLAEYRFTDITPTFIRRAQRELAADAPGLPLTFGALDLNKPLAAQGLESGAWDAIVGVNVVHVAMDLVPTLASLREALKPGGRLVVGECLKPDLDHPIYLELFFKFMRGFTDVRTDPATRPAHGFLTPEAWETALGAAGFSAVRRVPDTRALLAQIPTFYVGALAATR